MKFRCFASVMDVRSVDPSFFEVSNNVESMKTMHRSGQIARIPFRMAPFSLIISFVLFSVKPFL